MVGCVERMEREICMYIWEVGTDIWLDQIGWFSFLEVPGFGDLAVLSDVLEVELENLLLQSESVECVCESVPFVLWSRWDPMSSFRWIFWTFGCWSLKWSFDVSSVFCFRLLLWFSFFVLISITFCFRFLLWLSHILCKTTLTQKLGGFSGNESLVSFLC